MTAKNMDGPVHFFASSFKTWETSQDLRTLISRMKRLDLDGYIEPKGFSLWRCPGEKKDYSIMDYNPEIEGALFIAHIKY